MAYASLIDEHDVSAQQLGDCRRIAVDPDA